MPLKSFSIRTTGRAWLSLCLLLALLPFRAAAEGNVSVTPYLDFNYSGNIFWDSSAVSDTTYSPGLELNLDTRMFNFFLNADGKLYRSNDYLNHSTVYGGFSYFKVLSARSTLFLSPDFTLTQFKGEMSYLNAAIPSLSVGLKQVFSGQIYSRIGLNLRHSNYLEYDSFDRLRMAAFWEMSAFFRTQTTLRLTMGMNYLFFPHIFSEIPATPSESDQRLAAAAVATAQDSRYRRGNPDSPLPVPPAPPEPPLPPVPPDPSDPLPKPQISTVPVTSTLSIPQPFLVFRMAQGLGYKTGLIAEVQVRKNPRRAQSFEALIIDEWALQQMDEDFFWQGTRLSLALRTEAVFKLEIAVDFSYFFKEYGSMEALDMDGVPILPLAFREDRLSQLTMKIARSFGSVGFYVTGSYRKNISNDLYFRYGFYTISAGLDYAM